MSLKLDHIGYAVKDIVKSIKHYKEVFGIPLVSRETISDRGIEIAFLALNNTKIELLMGINNQNPISTFIEKRGEGLHHVCYEVADIKGELARLKGLGVTLIDETPRNGAHGTMIAFLHPKSFMGVLTELCQYTAK